MLNLIEIDFLHEMPPIEALNRYVENYAHPKRAKTAKPYHIGTTHPRRVEETHIISDIAVYTFGVDEPIPQITIPLIENEEILADVGKAYVMTFERTKKYMFAVDYSQLPIGFDKYSLADQQRIQVRMATAIQEITP